MDGLADLRVFAAVAELRSFTAAAGRLGLSPAMASKHVAHLETRLGARLLNRTSRSVSLTETGALYLGQVRPMLDGLDEVEAAVSNVAIVPRGTLRVSAPVWMANHLFAGVLAEYRRLFPEVCLDLDLSGRIVGLVEEGFDLALRATTQERLDPTLIARPMARVAFKLVGTPGYLERAGRPRTLSGLKDHALLLYSPMGHDGSVTLGEGKARETVRMRPVMLSANETILHLAALEGMGLTFLPVWLVREDIAAGRLEVILPDHAMLTVTLHAIYPSRRYVSAKVRTFIDLIATRLKR